MELNSKGYEESLYAKGCMRTYTGIYVPIQSPEPKHFCIEDIAHALSMIPRFGGHFPVWYSVADHSLYCAKLALKFCCPKKIIYQCLMHDSSEAYLNDIVSPLKHILKDYIVTENYYMHVLDLKFNFGFPLSGETKEIDKKALEMEWEILTGKVMIPDKNRRHSEKEFLEAYIDLCA